ncbi:hypothetical protein D9756_011443 [Leucocoprinus leucothites]|uniref:Uncharacterized protein n=1 Tax=Leucocoprinus leucothites TaxID=201217 RepID=A0A8H5CMV8_9AGAR|nr:hypothetical protein D9756_011443 [Leucoagaricus leucothites]
MLQPGDLFDLDGRLTSRIQGILSKVLKHTPAVPSIIITNPQEIIVCLPPARRRPEYTFEKITTTQLSLALRVISTAFLLDMLPDRVFFNAPSMFKDPDDAVILPVGPPQDPGQPLLTDEEVFSTFHRHSDFDLVTLLRDRKQVLLSNETRTTGTRRSTDEISDGEPISLDRITPPVKVGLSRVLKHTPSVPSIILTNLQDIVLFLTPTARRPGYCFEKIVTDNPPLALRAISTAYLYDELPDPYFINIPSLDGEDYGPALVLPEGPHQDPAQPLLSDEEVFFGCQRHSDFDLVTLFRDRARALQFFRWHEHVQKEYAKLVAHPGDAISAVTNQFGRAMPDMHPIFPLNLSELPPDTAAHIKEIQRESPLLNTGFEELFLQSQRFTLQVDDIITEGSENGICTVYRCSITSIDGTNLSAPSPALCLKLFDDRFQKLDCPTKEFLEQLCDNEVPLSSGKLLIAEILALNEVFTYNKLRVVQGSAFPWFYGMHQVTLPNGVVLYGLLMEYIEGWSLNSLTHKS